MAQNKMLDEDELKAIHKIHEQKKQLSYEQFLVIGDDLQPQSRTFRSYSAKQARYTGLRSRRDVMHQIFTMQGVYIYTFSRKNGGHAIAFDTRNDIHFMDPNFGEWFLYSRSEAEFRDWWCDDYWQTWYKKDYHQGSRFLYQYG